MASKRIDLSFLNSVEIPKKGKYKISLVDGSEIYLRRRVAVDYFFEDIEEEVKKFKLYDLGDSFLEESMKYEAPYKLIKKGGDQGWDIQSTVEKVLKAGETYTFPTGVKVEFHPGVGAYVVPRSGMSSKGILCHLGLVDSSYRGEIGVNLTNLNDFDYTIQPGDRIGQLVFFDEKNLYLQKVGEIACDTDRGAKGFGSSGR